MTVRTNILISFVRGSSSTQPVTLSFCVGVVVEIRSAGCFLCRRLVVTHLSPVSGDGERNFISVRNIHPSYLSAETLISTSASHTSPLYPSPILSFSSRLLSFFLSYHLCFVCFPFQFLSCVSFPSLLLFCFPPVPFLYRNSLHLRFYFHFLLFLDVSFPYSFPIIYVLVAFSITVPLLYFLSFVLLSLLVSFCFYVSFPFNSFPTFFPFLFLIALHLLFSFHFVLFLSFPFLLSSFLPSLLVSCFFLLTFLFLSFYISFPYISLLIFFLLCFLSSLPFFPFSFRSFRSISCRTNLHLSHYCQIN